MLDYIRYETDAGIVWIFGKWFYYETYLSQFMLEYMIFVKTRIFYFWGN